MRMFAAAAVSLLLYGAWGCSNPADAPPFDGTWTLTLSDPYPGSGTINIQDGHFEDIIHYTRPLSSGALQYNGNVDQAGNVQGQIVLVLVVVGSFEGTLAGNSGNGTYAITEGVTGNGTWTAVKR